MKLSKRIISASATALALGIAPLGALAQSELSSNPMGVSSLDPGETHVTRAVKLGANKSIIIDLDRAASDVIITNPEIADATVQTARRIIFRGVDVGQTNAFIFDVNGRPLLNLEITVDIDTAVINEMIERYVPSARVTVESANNSLILSGIVNNLVQSDQIMRLASAYLPQDGTSSIVNMMTIRAKDQVMLEVRIVEMQRTVIKQLGINLSGTSNFGDFANLVERQLFTDVAGDGIVGIVDSGTTTLAPGLPFTNRFGVTSSNSFGIQGGSLGGLNTNLGYNNYVGTDLQSNAGAAIDALERVGIVRTLAEPNIMAVSGESAKFLAGGEFPVPVAQEDNEITIE